MRKLFSKNDLLVVIVVSLAAIVLLIPHFIGSESLTAEISVDSKTVEIIDLNEIKGVRDITLDSEPTIKVRMENGRICVIEAECKDKLCQKCGWLDSSGDAAVCLPAKVVITVKGSDKSSKSDTVDVITY